MNLNRKDFAFRFPFIPPVTNANVVFTIKGARGKSKTIRAKQGDIITRGVWGNTKIFIHYGFIHGWHESGKLLIWENNANGVECITYEDFIQGKELLQVIPTSVNYEDVMTRAQQRACFPYNEGSNNCGHFVNYSIFGVLDSKQSENTRNIVNTGLYFFELYLQFKKPQQRA